MKVKQEDDITDKKRDFFRYVGHFARNGALWSNERLR